MLVKGRKKPSTMGMKEPKGIEEAEVVTGPEKGAKIGEEIEEIGGAMEEGLSRVTITMGMMMKGEVGSRERTEIGIILREKITREIVITSGKMMINDYKGGDCFVLDLI